MNLARVFRNPSLPRQLKANGFARSFILLASLCLSLLCQFSGSKVRANAVDWPTLSFTQVVTNVFNRPIGITHAGDGSGRIFVVEQPGRIWIAQSNILLTPPFLGITNRVLSTGNEQGLLGLAFPPGFSTNHHFYVDYTRQTDGAIVISRFFLTTTNLSVANTNSEQIVKIIPKPPNSPAGDVYNNHNGGQLAFGPDGFLYVGVGDGGLDGDPLNYGQNTSVLFGKILRINVESGVSPYAIPTNNPYVGNTNYAPETWAYGLRNPWRCSFDRLTGDLYIGDVGENSYEEIDFQPAGSGGGQNYGWRITEGPTNYIVPSGFTNFSTLTQPVATYSHRSLPTDLSAAVIGGYVYRGPNMPRMNGIYFYGDFEAGWIWGLKQTGTNWQNLALTNPGYPVSNPTNFLISTFGEDDQGSLYFADFGKGKIYQLQDTLQAWAPTFSPAGGMINNSNLVTVSCVTTGAVIHYTTTGLDPTAADPVVTSGSTISVVTGITNKLRAFRADLTTSSVTTAIFTNQVGPPVFAPAATAVTNGTRFSLSTITPGARIYFTTNGTTPTTTSALYSVPIVITPGITLEALGVASGYSNSAVTITSYSIVPVATPVFSPSSGPITNGTPFSISCATPGSTIYYTLDGSAPTTSSSIYTGSLIYDGSNGATTLNAFASANNYTYSAVQTFTYGLLSPAHTVVTTLAGRPVAGYTNATGRQALFSNPQGVCRDKWGNFFVADTGNNVIRKISPSGQVTTFAGNGVSGSQLGAATNTEFNGPTGVCADNAGNIYVADGNNCNRICKIATNGMVTLLVDVQSTNCLSAAGLWQLTADGAGNIYVGSWASVVKVTTNGIATHLAGPASCCADLWGYNVGPGIDPAGNIYAASGFFIWAIAPDGTTSNFAGSGNVFSDGVISDGPRLHSGFQSPQDVAVDSSTNLLISDSLRVRKISPDGWVSTVAGSGDYGYQDGAGTAAQFNGLAGLCVDTNGNIYVADAFNNCIREISPDTRGIGIPDWWQLAHFGYVGIDPNADPDHDGLRNYSEFWAGTDPLNASSGLAINLASFVKNGYATIRWQTVAGKTYAAQYSNDMVSWTNLGSSVLGDGTLAAVNDPSPVGQTSRRYYRVAITGL